MIGDVLMEAVDDIEDFERELPVLYGPVQGELSRLKEHMRQVVALMNTAPVLPFALGEAAGLGCGPGMERR